MFAPVFPCTLVLLSMVSVVSPEAFSSTAHLKLLSRAEGEVVGLLNDYVDSEVERLNKITNMIPVLEKSVSSKPNSAGHPVNAYHLVKRWYLISQLASNVGDKPEFQEFVNAHGLQMPTEADYIGSSAALLRLQRTYKVPTADLVKGKVFDEYSEEPLYADDCFLLGDTATKNNDYGLAAQWFDMATQVGQADDHGINLPDTYMRLAQTHKLIGDMAAAVEAAKKAEQLAPDNSTIKAEMWSLISQLENLQKENYDPRQNMSNWERFLPDWKTKYEALCRGDTVFRPPEVLSSLTCRYKPGRLLPYVTYKEETLSWDPRISMFYDVISDSEAEMIKRLATPLLYRAVVGDPAKAFATNERVSKVAWLWDTDTSEGPAITRLSDRIEDVTGLETEYRPELSSSEPFQVVNYGIGGQYEPHVDFYEDKTMLDSIPYFIQMTGDRITTFLFYLSDIKYGGATVFPQVGVRVPAVKNAAAFWYNAKPSGQFDGNTQHAGCPVLVGEKWVANKWIREHGQEFRRPCPLDQHAIWDV